MKPNDIIRLIVIEESANDAEVILNSLRKARYPIRPRHVEDAEDFAEALNEHEWDLIISVTQVAEFTVEQACEIVLNAKLDIPVIALLNRFDPKQMGVVLAAGAKQAIPTGNDGLLQIVVGRELDNLTERRKRRHLEQMYRETQRHNIMLLQSSRDAIAYVHDGMHIHANPSYLEMFGYQSMDELEGLPIMDLVSLDDQGKFKEFMREFMSNDRDDEREISLEGVKNGNKRFKCKMEFSQAIYDSERCVQIIIRDQSQSQELEQQLREAALRDPLTQLYNRQHFIPVLEKTHSKTMEQNSRNMLLYLVLDNYNSIRENSGLTSADALLKNVGQVLEATAKDCTVCRFSENIFTILAYDTDVKAASDLATTLCKAVEGCVTEFENGTSSFSTCSIGLVPILASASSSQDLLNDAANACKTVTERGGNGFEVFKAVIKAGETGAKITDIAKMIETAIEENRLSLHYQPIVSLRGETQEIYEIYLRMVDSENNRIPPGQVFAAAEKANLTIHLDKWVLKEAFKVLLRQQQAGHNLTFFIKLTDQAIRDENILLFIRKALKSTQIPGERLVFEISETVAISQVKLAKAFINSLNNMGCKTALEHFGTGLNSASTLKHLPVDFVKIDSSFCRGLSNNADNQKSVKEIVTLAHELERQTIAESVEDANSLTILWQCEVDLAQGNYIQEPSEELNYDFSEEG